MQENTFGRGGVVCRLRSAPRVLGVAALAVPVVAGLGVAYGLPAVAGGHRAAAAVPASVPADTVRLASSSGEKDDAGATRSRAAAPKTKAGKEKSRHDASLQDETGEEELTDAQRLEENSRAGHGLPRATRQEAFRAWVWAGYGSEDAVALAALWHRNDIEDVKYLAGRKLLAGRTLPVAPSYPPATAEDKAVTAFFDAGFDTADAELLATLYGFPGDLTQAKATAGAKLLAGGELPIEHGQTAWTVSMDAARATFFNNGYDYDDAVKLAAAWGLVDPADAKTGAGQKLLAGLPLPLAA